MLLHASRGGEHVLYIIYIPSSIFISCFIGHVNMLLHAARGGEHFTHKREKSYFQIKFLYTGRGI